MVELTQQILDDFANEFKIRDRKIQDIELEIEKLKTHINSLRGLVNRKLGQETSSDPATKKVLYGDGLDCFR